MLKCCVPYCKNTSKNSEEVTFHVFPTKPILRAAWWRLLNKKEGQVSEESVVCSKHFLCTDFYMVDGTKKLRYDALPSVVQVCMICLDTDSKLMSISQYKLKQAYEDLTGLILCKEASLCVECATRLTSFKTFRDKSLRANSLIAELVEKHKILRIQDVKTVNRDNHHLTSSIGPKTFKPNYCDLYIVEYMEDDPHGEPSNDNAVDVEITNDEQNCYAFIDDYVEIEYTEDATPHDYDDIGYSDIKYESVVDYAQVGNIEPKKEINLKIDDTANVQKTVYLSGDNRWLKPSKNDVYESAFVLAELSSDGHEVEVKKAPVVPNYGKALKCPMCVKVFLDEKLFNEHMKTHIRSEDSQVKITYVPTSTSQRYGSTQQKFSKSQNKYFHEKNKKRQQTNIINKAEIVDTILDNNIVKTEIIEDTEQNNKMIIYNLEGDKSYIIDNGQLIKSEDDNNTRVLAYNLQTDDIISDGKVMTNVHKDLNSAFDRNNLQVLSYNVVDSTNLKENNKPSNSYNGFNETNQQKRVLSYNVHTENIIIDTFESNVSENDVFLDKINFNDDSNEPEANNVDRHLKINNDDKPYCCHVCSKRFAQHSTLQSHMTIHTGDKPFACKFCDFKSTHRGSLERHEMIHMSKKQFLCHLCSKSFTHARGLIVHLKTHTGEKPYTCGECQRKFAEKVNLEKHMKTHTGERPYACGLCDFNCIHRRSLLAHERTHTGDKPYICEVCGYRSRSRNLMLKHSNTHSDGKVLDNKLFNCEICAKTFTNKYSLKAHMNMHTGENMFACHYCGKKFGIKSNLVLHLRTHTGEKPYTCEICQYKFSKQTNYQRHWKIHTGEKPYACPLCPYRSTQSNTLRCHMRTHTGEKPFACEICDYRATERRTLKNHMRTHSDEAPLKRSRRTEVVEMEVNESSEQ